MSDSQDDLIIPTPADLDENLKKSEDVRHLLKIAVHKLKAEWDGTCVSVPVPIRTKPICVQAVMNMFRLRGWSVQLIKKCSPTDNDEHAIEIYKPPPTPYDR